MREKIPYLIWIWEGFGAVISAQSQQIAISSLAMISYQARSFGLPLGQTNILAAAVILALALLAHLPLGIMAAGFVLIFKRGDPVTLMFGHLSALLGGVYFPLQVLPP